ncbi:MAG: diacylglycerol kinase family protein [Patescibacteria group bacterium]
MPRSYYFIINPAAGKGKRLSIIPDIQAFCRRNAFRFETVMTKQAGDATQMARAAASSNDVIVAVGGDGTVNEVVNGIAGTGTEFGIIPTGSGNDFAHLLGIRTKHQAFRALARGTVRKIDLGQLNGERYFINAAGVGFDGDVAARVRTFLKYSRGFVAYLLAVLRTLIAYRFSRVRVELDNGRVFEKQVLLVAACNGTTYGGGFYIAPSAKIDDSVLTVCIIDRASRLYILRCIPKILKGTHVSLGIVHTYTTTKLDITCEQPAAAQVDGEVLPKSRTFSIKIIPAALSVLTP